MICSTHFCFAQKSRKQTPSPTFTYDSEFFNKDGTCKPFPNGVENRKYKLSRECGDVEANIGLAKYSSNTFEVFFCVPQMNPSPLKMDQNKPLQGVFTRTHITLINNRIKKDSEFISGPKNRTHIFGDNSVTLHTLGNGGNRTLIGSDKKPEECQIKIEKIGTVDVTYSGGGKRLADEKRFDSKNMEIIEQNTKSSGSSGSEEKN